MHQVLFLEMQFPYQIRKGNLLYTLNHNIFQFYWQLYFHSLYRAHAKNSYSQNFLINLRQHFEC